MPLEVKQLRILDFEFTLVFLNEKLIGLEQVGVLKEVCLVQDALLVLLSEVFSFFIELISKKIFIESSWVELIVTC